MAYTKEQIEKAKTAENVEELIAIAKAEGFELSEENAASLFAELRAEEAELSDEELDNVAGGSDCDVETKEIECFNCHYVNPPGTHYCENCSAQIVEIHIPKPM